MPTRTHVAALVDESVSMTGVARGVRIGVNAYITELRDDPATEYLVTLATFSDDYTRLCTAAPLPHVPRLDESNYRPKPSGNTALVDAIGTAITELAQRTADATDHVVFVVVSDGEDNASRTYCPATVSRLVSNAERAGWTFLHLDAHPGGVRRGSDFGLHRLISLVRSDLGRTDTFTNLGRATRAIAGGADADLAAKLLRLQLEIGHQVPA